MSVTNIAKQIELRINALESKRKEIASCARGKAKTSSEYDKKLALTIIRLKNGVPITIEEETISNPPATIIEKIAKGVCWREKLDMDTAEGEYKAIISEIGAIQSELNGYQSIYRHLDEK